MDFEILSDDPNAELKNTLYNIILKNDGIVCPRTNIYNKGSYFIDDEEFFPEDIENLVKGGIIGKRDRTFQEIGQAPILLFDNSDARFTKAKKHPMGIETYYELKCEAKHTEKDIPILLDKILEKYERLLKKHVPRSKILATAIALTCRGEYQCPVNMRRYFGKAGGPSAVMKAGERIGANIRYDPDKRIKAFIPKLGLKGESLQEFMRLWRKDKEKGAVVNGPYAGGLAYLAKERVGQPETLLNIGIKLNVSGGLIGDKTQEISIRLGFRKPRGLSKDEALKFSEEFQKKLGPEKTFRILSYKKASLQTRLKVAEYLMENNHNMRNPTNRDEITEKCNLSDSKLVNILGMGRHEVDIPHLSLNKMGVYSSYHGKKIYIEDAKRLREYVSLIRKVISKLNN